MTFYAACVGLLRIWLRLCYRLRVEGPEVVPPGGALLASSHASFLDPIVVGSAWPGPVYYLARSTLFHPRWFGKLLLKVNARPIEREGGDARAFTMACRMLEEGHKLLIFPEGTRSKDGNLQPLKGGVSRLAARTGCSVVPIYVVGAYDIWGRDRRFPKLFGRIVCRIGRPIYWDEFAHLERRAAYEAFDQRLMAALIELRDRDKKPASQ